MRIIVVALSLVAGAFAEGNCGLADVFPDAESFSDPEAGTCFEGKQQTISPLESFYRRLLLAKEGGGDIKMFVKDWDTHKLNAAIAYILIHEIIGYPKPLLCTTAAGTTAGSFEMLSETGGRQAEVDIDMELWASSAYAEYLANEGSYTKAGKTFSYGRSGLFLRPGGSDEERARLLNHGRMYNNLERDVLPMLPTLRQARSLSQWCDVGDSEHCMEVPNRACHALADTEDCRVLLKSWDSMDKGTVEEMINNASLPLVIVYTGARFDYLTELPEQTFLFYHWEPALIIAPKTEIMRVVLEDPVMCEPEETFVSQPSTRACDFRQGLVHKGHSRRLGRMFPEVAYLIENCEWPVLEPRIGHNAFCGSPILPSFASPSGRRCSNRRNVQDGTAEEPGGKHDPFPLGLRVAKG